MARHLPAGCTMGARRGFENFRKAVLRERHFAARPICRFMFYAVLPLDVIPCVDTDFKALITAIAQDVAATFADVRSR